MMGRQTVDQSQLFYLFNLERRIPGRPRGGRTERAKISDGRLPRFVSHQTKIRAT
jgi:hypothetical protein